MNITTISIGAPATEHAMDLIVEQAGPLGINVKAGAVRFGGADESLGEDQTYDVVNRPQAADITCYMVRDTFDGSLTTLVDDVVLDGVDQRYVFRRGEQYELIAHLWQAHIPADTSDLAIINLRRFTLVERGES